MVIVAFTVGVIGFLVEIWKNDGASGPAWAWLGGGTGGAIVGGGLHAFARMKRKINDPDGDVET